LQLDLSSLRIVRDAAAAVNSWDDVPKIDILINNAALMGWSFELSEDGIEKQFATNHIGAFLFTNLILPKIVAAKGRIVNVSSAGHRFSPVRFEDWNFNDGKEYNPQAAYGQSKTANMLYAVSLAEKLKNKGVTAFSLHPGRILTNMGRHLPVEVLRQMGLVVNEDGSVDTKNSHLKFKTHSQGSATTLVAALDSGIAERSGEYLSDCQIDHEKVDSALAAERGTIKEEYALDRKNAEKLWELSERLVGEKFDV
jgi:NAD(P)-dependent dehydrogenase (short-subunit alcohol dehydrogenase family)